MVLVMSHNLCLLRGAVDLTEQLLGPEHSGAVKLCVGITPSALGQGTQYDPEKR